MSEPHEVVKLLLKRMKSHPEEFKGKAGPYHDRWYEYINGVHTYGSEADKAAMAAGLREIRLAGIHEQVMDELCNGEERRRKENEEQEYERNLSKSLLLTKHQMTQQLGQTLQDAFVYDSDLDRYENRLVVRKKGE